MLYLIGGVSEWQNFFNAAMGIYVERQLWSANIIFSDRIKMVS